MKGLTVLLATVFVLMGASVAFAGCYQERLTDPRKFEFIGTNLDGNNSVFCPCSKTTLDGLLKKSWYQLV